MDFAAKPGSQDPVLPKRREARLSAGLSVRLLGLDANGKAFHQTVAAVVRHNMRFVPIKTDDQLDLQALHRVRDRLVHWRTAVINQIRGLLQERGITFARGPAKLRSQMATILEDADTSLTPRIAILWITSGKSGNN